MKNKNNIFSILDKYFCSLLDKYKYSYSKIGK